MKSALVVIDVQRGLFDEAPRPADADRVVGRINALLDRARGTGVPVIFVQHERPEGNLEFGSPSWALETNIRTAAGDHFIRKTTPDSFLRTGLAELLDSLDATDLVVCGYATEFCVDTTVRRAAALGYPVVLVADAHTTHDKAHASAARIRIHHNATLPDIASFGVEIRAIDTESVTFNT